MGTGNWPQFEARNVSEEVISEKFNPQVAKDVIRSLLMLSNVYLVNIYYEWKFD